MVFISFSSEDKSLADKLVAYLEGHSLKCFIAHRDIPVSEIYSQFLMDAIENCEAMVLILSRKSNGSQFVLSEIEKAFQYKKRIIVFRTDNIALSKNLAFFLSTKQWFEAHEMRPENYFAQLAASLKNEPVPPIPKRFYLPKQTLFYVLLVQFMCTLGWLLFYYKPMAEEYQKVDGVNSRGIRLTEAIAYSGLSDIESKGGIKTKNVVPPEQMYARAKKEIFISGIGLTSVFQNQLETLRAAKNKGIKIRLLLLHPNSPDSVQVNKTISRFQSFSNTIKSSLGVIQKDKDLFQSSQVEVRFYWRLPQVVGLLFDGDIDAIGDSIRCPEGRIRFSNYLKTPDRNDWYFQFDAKEGTRNAFDDFAREFRYDWQHAIPLDSLKLK
jgi:hypothetical protein